MNYIICFHLRFFNFASLTKISSCGRTRTCVRVSCTYRYVHIKTYWLISALFSSWLMKCRAILIILHFFLNFSVFLSITTPSFNHRFSYSFWFILPLTLFYSFFSHSPNPTLLYLSYPLYFYPFRARQEHLSSARSRRVSDWWRWWRHRAYR